MEGLFLIKGMELRTKRKGPNARLKAYLRKHGVDTKDASIKISACKGGGTTQITLKDVLKKGEEEIKVFYLGLTKDTKAMEENKWEIYLLDKKMLETGFKQRYKDELDKVANDLNNLLNSNQKNYRVNVGKDYVEKNKCKKEKELSNV